MHGKNALEQLYRGCVLRPGESLVFLDFDDVICLQDPYSGYDVFQNEEERPADLWDLLFAQEAKEALLRVFQGSNARLVLTTSWLRLAERPTFEAVFNLTGLGSLVQRLHPQWEAPAVRGGTRWDAIERWLAAHYQGEAVAVLDDHYSGTGLAQSRLFKTGRVFLCEVGQGLKLARVQDILKALNSSGN